MPLFVVALAVISQVDQSYSDEIAGLKDRKRQAEGEADQLQAQRREDISKLLQERQRRLQLIASPTPSPDRHPGVWLTESERTLASEDNGEEDEVSSSAWGHMQLRAQGPTYLESSKM